MINESTDWGTFLVYEKIVVGLLGKLWFEYPEHLFVENLAIERVFEEMPFAGEHPDVQVGLSLLQQWTERNQAGLSESEFDAIRSDYTRLFIGPGKVLAPPWESVYFNDTRTIFDERTLQVRDTYRRFGLEPVRVHQEPDDHVGLEMAFLAHLAGEALKGLEAGDEAELERLLAAQKEFASQHLFGWFGSWYKLVEEKARSDFYRGLALLSKGVLQEVSEILGL